MWSEYFKVIGIRPGKVVVPRYGTLDFSKPDLPEATLLDLCENNFPYLEITEKGKEKFYGIKPVSEENPSAVVETEQTATSENVKKK